MSERTAALEALVEQLRAAELALEVAQATHDAGELEAAEARLAALRERHGRMSGWLAVAEQRGDGDE